jgi:hypothetical protein
VLLPQDPATDRVAMNLFQNWNFAPWQNPPFDGPRVPVGLVASP